MLADPSAKMVLKMGFRVFRTSSLSMPEPSWIHRRQANDAAARCSSPLPDIEMRKQTIKSEDTRQSRLSEPSIKIKQTQLKCVWGGWVCIPKCLQQLYRNSVKMMFAKLQENSGWSYKSGVKYPSSDSARCCLWWSSFCQRWTRARSVWPSPSSARPEPPVGF